MPDSNDPPVMNVWAANSAYQGYLTHQPSGMGFPADPTVAAEWPADQFTYALLREGSILDHWPP